MIQEIGRALAVLVMLIARLLGRAWRALNFLVRHAVRTRAATASTVTTGGRLLDLAVLSFLADLLVVVEWWRRSTLPAARPAVIGLAVGVLLAVAAGVFLRDRAATRFLLAGSEMVRLGCVSAIAFAPTVVVVGGTSNTALGSAAAGALIGLMIVERTLWTLCVRALAPQAGIAVAAAARYAVLLLVPMLLIVIVTLVAGGLTALLLAQVALLAAFCVALAVASTHRDRAVSTALLPVQSGPVEPAPVPQPAAARPAETAVKPKPRPWKRDKDSGPAVVEPPVAKPGPQEEPPFHVYRPSSLDEPHDDRP
ncbi:hypothetical protein [Hamadaea tsunoensis]|uniref:hypothetical protein n=1 Tax=Hamadaea tsunoensis TaxID=53368 RepID=UPI0004028952|nr:hypothetical protein [Hamadaea tsunoensis]